MDSKGMEIFDKLIDHANISDEIRGYLKDTIIEKVELNSTDNVLSIYFSYKQIIPKDILDKFYESLNLGLTQYKKIFFINRFYLNSLEEILTEYWLNILDYLIDNPSAYNILKNAKWELNDNRLCILIANDSVKELLLRKNVSQLLSVSLFMWTDILITIALECNEEVNISNQQEFTDKNKELEIENMLNENLVNKTPNKRVGTKKSTNLLYGNYISGKVINISEIFEEEDNVIIEGKLFFYEMKETKNGGAILIINITDMADSIQAKLFVRDFKKCQDIMLNLELDLWISIKGNVKIDSYTNELVLMINDIVKIDKELREDIAAEKRVELHLHTNMSAMDGISPVKKYIEQASKWGHKAIAVTDHGVVQAFPEAYEYGEKFGVKIIFGLEANVINDNIPVVYNEQSKNIFNETFVIFDIETTGLSAIFNNITEIGAIKINNGEVIDSFSMLVNPKEPISSFISNLTGITDEMVKNAPFIEEALLKFLDFIGDATMVAHNVRFDIGFININLKNIGKKEIGNSLVDTVELARLLYPDIKNYKLNTLCKHFNIELEHHRALNDAKATGALLIKMLDSLKERNIVNMLDINKNIREGDYKKLRPFHLTILVKNSIGLKNLYKIVSKSHIDYYYRCPRIPRSVLVKYREGLLFGSACSQGEVFESMLNKTDEEIEEIVGFYDYLEIQPIDNYRHLIKDGLVKESKDIINIHKKIIELGAKLNIPIVATGDVHYLDPEEEINRKILVFNQIGGYKYHNISNLNPSYFYTTNEMLKAFDYLDEEIAKKIVVDNPNTISNEIESLKPFPDKLYTPVIEGADDEIRNMSYDNAKRIYGEPLPEIVEKRLEKELNSIIKNGFSVIYLISYKLVKKSLEDGYLVGSRGSVGSSFVATMTEITEVNPLPPHYICCNCKYSEFILDGSYGSGFDLPDNQCPKCHSELRKEGHDIPFETFMGYEGDKVPDIDLNFSGEYQPFVHKYTEEIFGSEHVFRAGTISTVAEKTAYGYVKKYQEENNLTLRQAEINRLVIGCTGIKRTTGQHPGGLMVIPQYKDVFDFTPIQRPADDMSTAITTTHFDYHAISGRLLKLDILGHDDPTALRMLQDLTNIDPSTIPIDDQNVYEIFTSNKSLKFVSNFNKSKTGSIGIPEFGTKFVRQMLEETKPTTFSELVRISGLSHGTDVWLNNAQELIKNKKAKLSEVICTRDDIMVYLNQKGLESSVAFKISEKVRKGKGLNEDDIDEMKKHNISNWYIESCQKIKYMFPKAHAVAYVLMAVRIAYFKVYYPIYYYATYFSVRANEFDLKAMVAGSKEINLKINEIISKGNSASQKEKNLLIVLEVALEMTERGFYFLNVDLYKSDASKFIVSADNKGLIPPYSAISGIGTNMANNIINSREKNEFLSIEDFQTKCKVSKTVIEILESYGCLKDLPELNQLSLFE